MMICEIDIEMLIEIVRLANVDVRPPALRDCGFAEDVNARELVERPSKITQIHLVQLATNPEPVNFHRTDLDMRSISPPRDLPTDL